MQDVDKDTPIFDIHTLKEEVDATFVRERLVTTLSSAFGVVALVLVSVGLFGMMSFSVARRTAEIGLRMALGARPAAITWLFVRRTLILVVIGVTLGAAGAAGAGQIIRGLLVRTSASDPVTLTATIVLLAAVAAAACVIPARRAARLDPLAALRQE